MTTHTGLREDHELTLGQKLLNINWLLLMLLTVLASVGFAMLYSAANGSLEPWADRQMNRFAFAIVLMIAIAIVDLRFWLRIAYPAYVVALVLLVLVEKFGAVGMGAQRWLALGPVQIQPSELMKLALVLALARYFHALSLEDVGRPLFLVTPLVMVFAPAVLVLKQPDLGTAMLLIMGSGAIFFVAGVRIWKFLLVIVGGVALIPIAWNFLRDYQKQRVLTFLNPERDPLGAGYHITQSKIALGSGGIFGKGLLHGTQAHLSFLPEKQTDFIFTMLAEELGLVGGLALLGLYLALTGYGLIIAMRSRSQFGRLVGVGCTATFFLYVFINTAMVMGLIPVVGVPLPLVSYGGTAMLTVMSAFGLLMCVYVHRDLRIGRRGDGEF